MITIVLADDHDIVRRGIKMLLEAEKDYLVVGDASDSAEAVRLVEALTPDILVTDLHMGGMTGFDVIKKAPEDDCMHEMFVEIKWSKRKLAVPLSQIEPMETGDKTREAIEDRHYWVARGYELG